MKPYTKEELLELAPGYALGALTPEETAAVDSALGRDADLRREVASLREVAGTVLTSEPPMTPSAELRGRWMQRIRGGASARAIGEARGARGTSGVLVTRALGTLLAATMVIAAALGVQLRDSRRELASTHAALEKRERQLNTVLEAEAGLLFSLLKPTAAGHEGVQFYWNARQKRGMLHAFHLAQAPAGRAYQLWVIREGKPVSVRVFNSDADGHALVEQLVLPDSPDGVSVVAITVEPERGSPQPTTTPILAGSLVRAADKQ